LIYNDRPQVGTLIKILVNQIPKNLCLRLTAPAWECRGRLPRRWRVGTAFPRQRVNAI